MKPADGKIAFGPWLPDLPDLDNPGLTEARNVIPVDRTYKPYLPLTNLTVAAPGRPIGAIYPSGVNGATFYDFIYVGFGTSLYVYSGAWSNRSFAVYTSATFWRFAQFDEFVVATNGLNVPQRHTVGAAGNFAALATTGTAPISKAVGVVGRFVVLGDLEAAAGITREHMVQWCAIDDLTNWPTPLSASAVSTQAGSQELPKILGRVTGIHGGDQTGVVLQDGGVSRMTYVGGTVVFQFDTISDRIGCTFRNASIKIGALVYFPSARGFCVTDGVQIVPIGDGQCDRYFLDSYSLTNRDRMYVAHDPARKLIYWLYPTTGAAGGQPDAMLVYNYEEKRWARALQDGEVIFDAPSALPALGPHGFDSAYRICTFTGTAGTAILTSPEVEFLPGGRTHVQGVKAIVTGTAPTVTVAVGARDDQGSAATYTAESTPNSRTKFAGFRSDAQYHRARTTITGAFEKATGIEFQQVPSGAA